MTTISNDDAERDFIFLFGETRIATSYIRRTYPIIIDYHIVHFRDTRTAAFARSMCA